MRIIPAIDIIEGKCVRLRQGDYNQKKVYNENPLEVAKNFADAGIRYLHLVDLDGAKQKKVVNLHVLEQIASQTDLQIDFGGGVHTEQSIKEVLDAGATQITLGSIAVKDKELVKTWLKHFGTQTLVLGADAKNEKIAVSGWEEVTDLSLSDFIAEYQKEGIEYVICTDISKDGLLAGTSLSLYSKLKRQFPDLHLIASGGITTLDDLEKLQALRVEGAIIGKALYEGTIGLQDLQKFIGLRANQ